MLIVKYTFVYFLESRSKYSALVRMKPPKLNTVPTKSMGVVADSKLPVCRIMKQLKGFSP